MPLILAGARDGETCKVIYQETLMGAKISGFEFKAETTEKSEL